MKDILSKTRGKLLVFVVISGLILFGIIKYVDYRFNFLSLEIDALSSKIDAGEKLASLQNESLKQNLIETSNELNEILNEAQEKNDYLNSRFSSIRNAVNSISKTVGSLEKLSVTDPELLQKYSKTYFLNEHYVPISLSQIPSEYTNLNGKNVEIHSDVLPFLEEMLSDAKDAGLSLQILSAYRSFYIQAELKASYIFTYGAGTANKFSAEQGYSEHQLGTTMDFTNPTIGGVLSGFDTTPEYQWLLENAHKYGFVISYPEGNGYYKFEPWHFRFVGIKLATKLYEDNMYFYNMDQRIINTYLPNIFDKND